MHARGHYTPDPVSPWIGQSLFRPDTPSESASRYFFGHAPTNPTGMNLLLLGALAAVGVAGVVGIGTRIFTKSKLPSPPVTTSQKIVRVGLVGGLLAGGAYMYFNDAPARRPGSVHH